MNVSSSGTILTTLDLDDEAGCDDEGLPHRLREALDVGVYQGGGRAARDKEPKKRQGGGTQIDELGGTAQPPR